jgi:hypothetical protein
MALNSTAQTSNGLQTIRMDTGMTLATRFGSWFRTAAETSERQWPRVQIPPAPALPAGAIRSLIEE